MSRIPQPSFARKYDAAHAQQYYQKHRNGLSRRLSNWREQRIATRALRLAGEPKNVLDLPCGAGRFWPLLSARSERLYAADNSMAMLHTAHRHQAFLAKDIACFQASAFALPLVDKSVECIFCIRLLHHLESASDRQALLRELGRVAMASVIVSLWVDGNYRAWRRRRLERRRCSKHERNRFIIPRRQIEGEFEQAGLGYIGHVDFLKFHSMWRIYVLQP